MSGDRADVLVIGAGASGGVVGRRLAEAGFKVVCLEQGTWPDRDEFPGSKADWELQAQKQWSPDPNVRQNPADYPINAEGSEIVPLMFNGVGGSTILYAGDWPRLTPSDFRVKTLDGVADDWPLTYEELEPFYDRIAREVGVSGLAGRPRLPGGSRPAAACPAARGRGSSTSCGRTTGSAGTGGRLRTRSSPRPTAGAIRARNGAPACRAARRARRRRPTSPTGRRRSSGEPVSSQVRA